VSQAPFDPRRFIARAEWRLSKTTEDWPDWRHFYCVEGWYADDPEMADDFRRFVEFIEAEGYVAHFEKIKYRYLRVDEFVYWTSRSIYSPGQNLNRRPCADVEGRPDHEQTTLPL
jgi:chlorite dismutase